MNGKITNLIKKDPAYDVNYENKTDYHKMFKDDVCKKMP